MNNTNKTRNAVDILRRRFVGKDAEREAEVEKERLNASVAQMIYDLRNDAKLTQSGLAELVGTTQSVISRLEDSDYDGHSLTMLDRIAKALNRRVDVSMLPTRKKTDTVRYVFCELVRMLRRKKGLTTEQLAKKLDVEHDEVIAIERDPTYRPSPLTLHQLSKFFDIPERRLAALAGAVRDISPEIEDQAARFAAKSDSFARLSRGERRVLDDFVKALKSEV